MVNNKMMSLPFAVLFAVLVFECVFCVQWVDVRERIQRQVRAGVLEPNKRSLLTHRDLLDMEEHATVEETDESATVEGTKIERLQETYKGIPVYDAEVTIETDLNSGQYTGQGTGRFVEDFEDDISSTQPRLSEIEAFDAAVSHFGATDVRNKKSKLLIVADNSTAALVYEISFFCKVRGNISRPACFIDANTGQVLKVWEKLKTYRLSAVGGNKKTGKILYGVDKPYLDVQKKGDMCIYETPDLGVYDLKSKETRNAGVETVRFPCKHGISDSVNGAYSPATDAFFYGNKVVELFRSWAKVEASKYYMELNVHYGKNAMNAFFDGQAFNFGDGDPSKTYPLVSADVLSHEVAHCFSEEHADLAYDGQSGGIDESFSDLVGESAEHFIYGTNDWIAGDDVFYKEGLRDMCQQSKDGHSITNAKDFKEGMDVHYTSGVFNMVSCRLSTAKDWNIESVLKVFVHANRFYWHPTSDYNDAACGLLKATYDLGHSMPAVHSVLQSVGIQPCEVNLYTRAIPLEYTIQNLSAKKGERILFRLLGPEDGQGGVRLMTAGGTGDVDLYVGYGMDFEPSEAKWKSRNKGNGEIITIGKLEFEDVFVLLKAKKKHTFSDVKLSTKGI